MEEVQIMKVRAIRPLRRISSISLPRNGIKDKIIKLRVIRNPLRSNPRRNPHRGIHVYMKFRIIRNLSRSNPTTY